MSVLNLVGGEQWLNLFVLALSDKECWFVQWFDVVHFLLRYLLDTGKEVLALVR